jgi:hypothetical protein
VPCHRQHAAEHWHKRCQVSDDQQSRQCSSEYVLTNTRVAFVNGAFSLAKRICADQGSPDCERYLGYIQDGLNLIFVYQAYGHGAVGEGSSGEQGSQESGGVKRSLPSAGLADLGIHLTNSGYGFDSVEHVDVSSLKMVRRDSDPVLTHRSIFRNLAVENGTASDVAFNHFDNGDINMDYAGDLGPLPSQGKDSEAGDLQKRYNGSGYKISWTSRKRSLLTRAHQNEMSYYIASDWGSRADHTDEGDYIGLVETDHTANFYFRIIPELQGFGLNYESVNVCGQLAGFL